MPLAHDAHYTVNINRPVTNGFCDRCNMMYPLSKLAFQVDWRGITLARLGIRVCPTCYDTPQPNGRKTLIIGPDPVPVMNPRPGFQASEQIGSFAPYGQVPTEDPTAIDYILDEVAEPSPTPELWNNGGALALSVATGYPTSPSGLAPGDVWSNGGEVAIVAGTVPPAFVTPLYFPGITALQLLQIGGRGLPTYVPTTGSTQLWNNGGGIGVA